MNFVLGAGLNILETAKQTTHYTSCLYVTNREQLSKLLYMPLLFYIRLASSIAPSVNRRYVLV